MPSVATPCRPWCADACKLGQDDQRGMPGFHRSAAHELAADAQVTAVAWDPEASITGATTFCIEVDADEWTPVQVRALAAALIAYVDEVSGDA
jgi:hypothetical protein